MCMPGHKDLDKQKASVLQKPCVFCYAAHDDLPSELDTSASKNEGDVEGTSRELSETG